MATDLRLFVVTVTTETVVLAEDAEDAVERARADLTDILHDGEGPEITAVPMTYYPGQMDEGCIPYGRRVNADPDRTIGKWVERGAAPEMRAAKGTG